MKTALILLGILCILAGLVVEAATGARLYKAHKKLAHIENWFDMSGRKYVKREREDRTYPVQSDEWYKLEKYRENWIAEKLACRVLALYGAMPLALGIGLVFYGRKKPLTQATE